MKRIIQLYTSYLFIIIASLGVLNSCKKFINIAPPEVQAEQSKIFSDDQGAKSALSGLYTLLQSSSFLITNGGATLYPALSGDELNGSYPNPQYDQFQTNTLQPSHEEVIGGSMWQPAYKAIYQANAILEGLENPSSAITTPVKKQLKGETLTIRALLYFYLVNFFGDVPLVTTTNYIANQSMPRTTVSEIYQQIINDLNEAKTILNENYPSTERVRANKWAAAALLARIYLYNEEWQKAEAEVTDVLNSGMYNLETDLNTVFTSSSQEAIWQLMLETSNTAEGRVFVPYSPDAQPNYIIGDKLLSIFETGDERKINWLGFSTYNGQTFYYPYKYKLRSIISGNVPTEYNTVLRLGEQNLIRAEARANQNNTAGAITDLNNIRNRAGLNPTMATTKETILAAIAHERQTELFTEWGHRWLDLKRTGEADAVLSSIKAPNWNATDVLYPIPQSQLLANPFLVQNDGY